MGGVGRVVRPPELRATSGGFVTPADVARVRAATRDRKDTRGTSQSSPKRRLPSPLVKEGWTVDGEPQFDAAAGRALSLQSWNSGAPQQPGMWFQVELPKPDPAYGAFSSSRRPAREITRGRILECGRACRLDAGARARGLPAGAPAPRATAGAELRRSRARYKGGDIGRRQDLEARCGRARDAWHDLQTIPSSGTGNQASPRPRQSSRSSQRRRSSIRITQTGDRGERTRLVDPVAAAVRAVAGRDRRSGLVGAGRACRPGSRGRVG